MNYESGLMRVEGRHRLRSDYSKCASDCEILSLKCSYNFGLVRIFAYVPAWSKINYFLQKWSISESTLKRNLVSRVTHSLTDQVALASQARYYLARKYLVDIFWLCIVFFVIFVIPPKTVIFLCETQVWPQN